MRITMRDVAVATVLVGKLEVGELMGRGRSTHVVLIRQAAQWICAKRVGPSLNQVAAFFERDHTTLIHSIRAVQERLEREHENGATRCLINEIWDKAIEVARDDVRLNIARDLDEPLSIKLELPEPVVERTRVAVSAIPFTPRSKPEWVVRPAKVDDHFAMYSVL